MHVLDHREESQEHHYKHGMTVVRTDAEPLHLKGMNKTWARNTQSQMEMPRGSQFPLDKLEAPVRSEEKGSDCLQVIQQPVSFSGSRGQLHTPAHPRGALVKPSGP